MIREDDKMQSRCSSASTQVLLTVEGHPPLLRVDRRKGHPDDVSSLHSPWRASALALTRCSDPHQDLFSFRRLLQTETRTLLNITGLYPNFVLDLPTGSPRSDLVDQARVPPARLLFPGGRFSLVAIATQPRRPCSHHHLHLTLSPASGVFQLAAAQVLPSTPFLTYAI